MRIAYYTTPDGEEVCRLCSDLDDTPVFDTDESEPGACDRCGDELEEAA